MVATDPRNTVFTGPAATRYELPTAPDAVLHDDLPLRDGGLPDGASGSTGPTAAPSDAAAVVHGFSGLQLGALLVD